MGGDKAQKKGGKREKGEKKREESRKIPFLDSYICDLEVETSVGITIIICMDLLVRKGGKDMRTPL